MSAVRLKTNVRDEELVASERQRRIHFKYLETQDLYKKKMKF